MIVLDIHIILCIYEILIKYLYNASDSPVWNPVLKSLSNEFSIMKHVVNVIEFLRQPTKAGSWVTRSNEKECIKFRPA
jgi:hypothetical protein